VLPTRKPRRLVGRNVVTEFIAAGGGRGARERLLRRSRTEGLWDPQIPNFRAPAAAAEQICNFARTILDPYVQKDRGKANAGDDIETPNTAAGPSGSSDGARTGRFDLLRGPLQTQRSMKPACGRLKGPARSRVEHCVIMIQWFRSRSDVTADGDHFFPHCQRGISLPRDNVLRLHKSS
jgi:hypothetical protein